MDLNDYLYGSGRDARNKASAAAADAWAAHNEAAYVSALRDFAAASQGGTPKWAAEIDPASYAAQFGLNVAPPAPKLAPVPKDLTSIAAKTNDPTLKDVMQAIADFRALFVKAAGL